MLRRFQEWHPNGRYMFFPNSPDAASCPRRPTRDRQRHNLMLLGISDRGIDHEVLLDGMQCLLRRRPEMRLHIIGQGGEDRLRHGAEQRGIAATLVFHGFQTRERALEMVAAAGIGVVMYAQEHPWQYYGDSIKIREYAACGLPVICDGLTSTAEEAAQAGVATIVADAEGFAEAVARLTSDDAAYERAAAAALAWAKENDKRLFLEEFMRRIGMVPKDFPNHH